MKRGGSRMVGDRIYARVRYGKDDRLEERVPWAKTREEASARAEIIAGLCDRLVAAGRRDLVKGMARQAAIATTERALASIHKAIEAIVKGAPTPSQVRASTFKDVAELWVSGDLRKLHPDHVNDKSDWRSEPGRLRRYIYPHIGDVPMFAFEKSHGDLVMAKLPANRVKSQATRRHVAQIINRVCNLAVMPLGLIKANPLPRGWLPNIETRKHYSCLFPREERALLACDDVDEAFRLFVGILDREGMRVSELADSEWWQWNLEEGVFTATKTKTDDPRMWALRPEVAEAMRLWKKRLPSKLRPFIDVVPNAKAKLWLATKLREGIKLAGVERVELFESTKHTGMLRAHDLRATFVTMSLAEGKSETWIRDRTAHKTATMIDRYRRAARQVQELELGSLVDLVEGLGWGTTRGMTTKDGGPCVAKTSVVTGGSSAWIRTTISGIKSLPQGTGAAEASETPGDRPGSATGKHDVPQASPTLEVLRRGVQMDRDVWEELDRWELAMVSGDDEGSS